MNARKLPPNQKEINHILKWNIEHPGITHENPRIDLNKWVLTIDGKVQNPLKLTWQNLLNLPAIESKSDFHCIEGWSVKNCRWYGVEFRTITQTVKPHKAAKYVSFNCLDGYNTSLSLEDLLKDKALLAYKLNDRPLENSLGGPLRIVVPQKYAYKSAMWLEHITFTKTNEPGFWERRGFSDTADVWKNDRFVSLETSNKRKLLKP